MGHFLAQYRHFLLKSVRIGTKSVQKTLLFLQCGYSCATHVCGQLKLLKTELILLNVEEWYIFKVCDPIPHAYLIYKLFGMQLMVYP